MYRRGELPTALHNNCSGKHAGFLLLCKHNGWPTENYLDPEHPGQVLIRETIQDLGGIAADDFVVGIDGCSAPTFAFPLEKLAYLFGQLAKPGSGRYQEALGRVTKALKSNPRHIAGDDRFDTNLMIAGPFIAKGGAEGVHGGVHLPTGKAWAVKIADGNRRGASVTVLAWLEAQGLVAADVSTLAYNRAGVVRNHAGLHVGDSQYVGPTTALGSAG
jgi:L-asparaginase II